MVQPALSKTLCTQKVPQHRLYQSMCGSTLDLSTKDLPFFQTMTHGVAGSRPYTAREYTYNAQKDGCDEHTCTMLPLRLCYAWMIWKAQGQIFKCRVVVHLGDSEKEHGLTYVAVSRVRRLSDIGIVGGLSVDCLTKKIAKQAKMPKRLTEEAQQIIWCQRHAKSGCSSLTMM